MSGHEPEKAGHCLCLLLIRLDNLLLQSGSDLPCTTLPRCRLRPRTRGGFMVVAAEGGRGGAGDLLRLLLRQYVQESFGARLERSHRCPSYAPATVRLKELWSARRPWLEWCQQKEGTGGE